MKEELYIVNEDSTIELMDIEEDEIWEDENWTLNHSKAATF